MQQQAHLVGQEAVAGEAVREAGALQILDPVLRLAPVDIGVVDLLGWGSAGGHHEAGVRAGSQNLRLDDHPAWIRPRSGLIVGVVHQPYLDPAGLIGCRLRLRSQGGGQDQQAWISDEADGVGDPLRLAPGKEGRLGKPRIGPNGDGDVRPLLAQPCHDAPEDRHNAMPGVDRPRPQHGGDELARLPVKDQQRVIHVLAVIKRVAQQLAGCQTEA